MRHRLSSLMLTAALSGAAMVTPALAQETPNLTVNRAVPDLSALEQRLRDRGVPEDRIGVSFARIRAAIASGNYPHLERRIYNILNPDTADDTARRRLIADGGVRPEADRPQRPEVSRADDVRPDVDRSAAADAPAAPRAASSRPAVRPAPGLVRRQ